VIVPDALRGVLGKALEDAIAYREPQGECDDCDKAFEGRCADHLSDAAWCGLYRGAARILGVVLLP
jgi:hypothetical protein